MIEIKLFYKLDFSKYTENVMKQLGKKERNEIKDEIKRTYFF